MNENRIKTYFEKEHGRMDELFKNFQQFKRSDPPKAQKCFAEFRSCWLQHMDWEEKIIFPLFEKKTGSDSSTQAMRMEHLQIKRQLESMSHKVEAQAESDQEEAQLLSVLLDHHRQEEKTLYPAIDEVLSEEEIETVFTRMRAVTEVTR